MPAHETYLLHVYRSRAVSGWQWAARLEHLPSGESWRFTDPAALLAHLRPVLAAGVPSDPSADALAGTDEPAGEPQDEGSEDRPRWLGPRAHTRREREDDEKGGPYA